MSPLTGQATSAPPKTPFQARFVSLARLGCLILLGVWSSGMPSALAAPRDAIVHVAFMDGMAITENGNRFIQKLFKEEFPDADFVQITVEIPGMIRRSDDHYRKLAIDLLHQHLKPDHSISHLVITTHGSSTETPIPTTHLTQIGFFRTDGLNSAAKEFFAPFIGRFKDHAVIVLEACETFCGDSEGVQNRAKKLLEYLQIQNGQIFGAQIELHDIARPGNYSLSDLILISSTNHRQNYLILIIFTAVLYLLENKLAGLTPSPDPAPVLGDLTRGWLFFVGTMVLTTTTWKLISWRYNMNYLRDTEVSGQILEFKDGAFLKSTPVNLLNDFKKIYGLPQTARCAGYASP